MILLTISCLIFVALIVVSFLNFSKKLLVLSSCICLLVLINFLNEIQLYKEPFLKHFDVQNHHPKVQINAAQPEPWQRWKGHSQEYIWNELIEEQKSYANGLSRLWQEKKFSMVYFERLPSPRLKLILDMLVGKANSTMRLDNLEFYAIDYEKQKCSRDCLSLTFGKKESSKYRVLIAKNIEDSRDLTNLKEVYFEHNLTIVFENPKEAYKYNAINRFVEHYYFSNNYLSKFIGTYPEKTIQNCLAHRTFDYDLYIVSLITPLEELCSRQVPLTRFDRCVQKLFKGKNGPIPLGWARPCFEQAKGEIFNERNGWLYPKKNYNREAAKGQGPKGADL